MNKNKIVKNAIKSFVVVITLSPLLGMENPYDAGYGYNGGTTLQNVTQERGSYAFNQHLKLSKVFMIDDLIKVEHSEAFKLCIDSGKNEYATIRFLDGAPNFTGGGYFKLIPTPLRVGVKYDLETMGSDIKVPVRIEINYPIRK